MFLFNKNNSDEPTVRKKCGNGRKTIERIRFEYQSWKRKNNIEEGTNKENKEEKGTKSKKLYKKK